MGSRSTPLHCRDMVQHTFSTHTRNRTDTDWSWTIWHIRHTSSRGNPSIPSHHLWRSSSTRCKCRSSKSSIQHAANTLPAYPLLQHPPSPKPDSQNKGQSDSRSDKSDSIGTHPLSCNMLLRNEDKRSNRDTLAETHQAHRQDSGHRTIRRCRHNTAPRAP